MSHPQHEWEIFSPTPDDEDFPRWKRRWLETLGIGVLFGIGALIWELWVFVRWLVF